MTTDTFNTFKTAVQKQFAAMKDWPLFRVNLDKDKLWELYLSSYPPGTNEIYRERREHDCSACRHFIKAVGNVVAIKDGMLVSLWDCKVGGHYQVVADAMATFVNSHPIDNVFIHPESVAGVSQNFEQLADGGAKTWEHFHVQIPASMVAKGEAIGTKLSEYRAMHDVFLRALREIPVDVIDTVLDLIAQGSLYRGDEKKNVVATFKRAQAQYARISNEREQDLFAWSNVLGPEAWICKVRNDVIGTLMVDLAEGMDLEAAVKAYETKVAPTNYRRTSALITPKMKEQAKEKLVELGLITALERRFAVLSDINVQNVLFVNRDARKAVSGDVFDDLPTKAAVPKKLDKVEEVPIDDFIAKILPTAQSVELFFENRLARNLVSLVAPADATARPLFRWPNLFSWSYTGDVADSIKELVKKAGGNVTGDVCCRLAWHNSDDLDFHMVEPGGYEIYFGNRSEASPFGGRLDVDANAGHIVPDPVENIYYQSKSRMRPGTYNLSVHQYNKREARNEGFEVEIDVQGEVYHFAYDKSVRQKERIVVADILVAKDGSITVKPVLPSSQSVREIWGIKSQNFHPVQVMMLSPNFWDGQGVGNKHYMFFLDGCQNDGSARGFYNEFLRPDLEAHRKTMEIVGSRMRTAEAGEQLSGLGFSSTQRNFVLCRVKGSFTRTVKITF